MIEVVIVRKGEQITQTFIHGDRDVNAYAALIWIDFQSPCQVVAIRFTSRPKSALADFVRNSD